MKDAVTIELNGQSRDLPGGQSVAALISSLELTPQHVAVEINGSLVRRATFDATLLQSGDRVEIVTLVGGG